MPTLSFTPENRREQNNDFPKLKLKLGERKRIVCIEDPTFAYVHTLRAPKIQDGQAIKEEKKRRDGTTFVDYVRDFVGRPLCLGDEGILADKGSDPGNCPACARAAETDEVLPPERRFAMPVIVYRTKPGGFEVANPFSVDLVVWGFTEGTFGKLVEVSQICGSLLEHDLLLGPCQPPEAFQKFDIGYAPTTAFTGDENRQMLIAETVKEQRPANLEAACGRKVERRWLEDDLNKIADRWRVATGAKPANDMATPTNPAALADGLANLNLSRPAAETPPTDFGDLLGSRSDDNQQSKKDDGPVDFTSLLANM